MITGKDLIVYIIANNLMESPVYKDGKLIGFMTASEAAVKFDVALPTIKVWVALNMLEGIQIGNELFIPATARNPKSLKGVTNNA